MPSSEDRAQAHTLEAFAAAILIVAGLAFALQATAVTPLSASTSNQHLENQQRAVANDILETSAANGDLRDAVLRWDPVNETFTDGRSPSYFTGGGPPNGFGAALNESFGDRRIAFNVHIRHGSDNGAETTLVSMGSPSDNAVTATRTVVVTDDANLTAPGYDDTTLGALSDGTKDGEFYAADAAAGAIYDRLEVRIVVWQL
ncbi:hypothetical protein [Halorubrum sp. Boch-26]|uniref:DUF7288 family protein n=1 Tax=Halorubrum sp. Boch-26 TaxID=2994426 RepID=UPI0024691195|nr:hypothetical protein [Halorubrum sp. Boch-26]